jgi:translocation and assembly module TamA
MKMPFARALAVILALLLATPAAAEEATLRYATSLVPSGDDRLDAAIREASALQRLAETAPVDALGLIARARAEPRRLEDALTSEGFWGGRVEVLVAGQPPETPGLAERLADMRGDIPVELRPVPGERYTLRRIALRPASPDEAAAVAALGPPPDLAPGDPARAGPVLDAEAALLDRLRRAGHPLAAIADREVIVDHEAQRMDVAWTVSPGPVARFAMPAIEGDTRVNRALLARIAGRLEGQPYTPARQERTRRELAALGAFDTVRARAAQRLDAAGRLPVTFAVTDRPRNAAGVAVAYETEFGFTGRVHYERRNLWGNAETLRLDAEVSRLGSGSVGDETNYRAAATLRRPGLFDGTTSLVLETMLLREQLKAYDRDAFIASALLERPFGDAWVLRGGPIFETGRIGRDGVMPAFNLLGLVMAARYDGTDSLLDPRRGIRLDLLATPFADLEDGGGFLRALGTLRAYLDLTGDGGSVIALRGTLGSLLGADSDVPLDKRFYAGGGGSVRGYTFQSIGPRDSSNRPNGGSSLVEGSVELRQRLSGPFGVVGFLDAGSVGEGETPSFSDLRMGAGLGLRYATAIGPLRLDVGVPLNKEPGDPSFALYVGLGQAF